MRALGSHSGARGSHRLGIAVLTALSLGCAHPLGPVGEPPDPGALNLLFIGNSLTYFNEMPAMVQALLEEAGLGPVHVASVAFPNYGLEDHWLNGAAGGTIALGSWDYVVMQQGPSATEGRPSLLEYSKRFAGLITEAGATPALYMVWPAVSRSFDFDGVVESYAMAAEAAGAVLFPAGEAWRIAWRTDPDLELYGSDGFHPSARGSFLAALTIADRLAGASLQPAFSSGPVGPLEGALLLQAAREANARYR